MADPKDPGTPSPATPGTGQPTSAPGPPVPGKPAKVRIKAKVSTRREAVTEAVFDQLKPSGYNFSGTGINNDPKGGNIFLRRCRELPDGTWELSGINDVVTLDVGDPDARAAAVDDDGNPKYPAWRALMAALEPAVEELARERGVAVADAV